MHPQWKSRPWNGNAARTAMLIVFVGMWPSSARSQPKVIAPEITQQPADSPCTVGQTATFQVLAGGIPDVTYIWQRKANGTSSFVTLSNGGAYSGVTTNTLTVTNVTLAMSGDQFQCFVRNGIPDDKVTRAALLTVTSTQPTLPNIVPYAPAGWSDKLVVTVTSGSRTDATTILDNQEVFINWAEQNSSSIDVASSFSSRLLVDGAVIASWTTAASLMRSGAAAGVTDYSIGRLAAGTHTVRIEHDFNNAVAESDETDNNYSKSFAVTAATQGAGIVTQPQNVSVIAGATATFGVVATGSPTTFTYTWQRQATGTANFVNLTNTGNYSGVTTGTLSVTGTTLAMNGDQFRCVVSNGVGAAATSSAAILTVTASNSPPPNDNFANRISLSGSVVSTAGTNVRATKEAGEPSHTGSTGGASVWWTWTAPSAGTVTISLAGSSFDTLLAVYTGTAVGALTSIVSNDDFGGQVTSQVTFTATAGTAYQIAVDGYQAATGNITMTLRLVTFSANTSAYTFSTYAGTAGATGGTDGSGSVVRFSDPTGIAVDRNGNVYVTEFLNKTVRKITPAGVVTTLAGLATQAGNTDATGSAARFGGPMGVGVDSSGNVYVADQTNHSIRVISPSGVVTTFAGRSGSPGSTDGTGANARFNSPSGLAVDGAGNIYVSDNGNSTIRKITATGIVTTLAGSAGITGTVDGIGSAARFRSPSGIAVDGAGNVYVADETAHTIRKITPVGGVTTLAGLAGTAGTADGAGANARFNLPAGLAVDRVGNLDVADRANNTIRRITAAGLVSTVGGFANQVGTANGAGSVARFNLPWGLGLDIAGNLYVGDSNNRIVRKGLQNISRLINIATRGFVQPGGKLTPGFVMLGVGTKQLVVRGVGPTLGSFGLGGTLSDPQLEVVPQGGVEGSAQNQKNDDWSVGNNVSQLSALTGQVGAFALAASSKDSSTIASLPVNITSAYTVVIKATTSAASGLALAEVYDTEPSTSPTRIINVSTLGFTGTDANVLTPGFVISGDVPKLLLIRAVGPGLAPFNVPGTLADPQLVVIPLGSNVPVASNNDWGGAADLRAAFGLAGAFSLPDNSRDAAVVVSLQPGAYTVQVSGINNTSGVVLAEVYDLDP